MYLATDFRMQKLRRCWPLEMPLQHRRPASFRRPISFLSVSSPCWNDIRWIRLVSLRLDRAGNNLFWTLGDSHPLQPLPLLRRKGNHTALHRQLWLPQALEIPSQTDQQFRKNPACNRLHSNMWLSFSILVSWRTNNSVTSHRMGSTNVFLDSAKIHMF